MFAKSILGLAALATMAVADTPVPNYGSALNMTIDPNSVPAGTKSKLPLLLPLPPILGSSPG